MTTKRAKTEKTKTGVTARTPETKATPPPAILLTRDQFTGDPIADHAAEGAAESLRRLSPDNAILRTALCNAMTEKTEAIRKATPDQSTWTPMQRQWLALRVTKKGEAVKYGEARWLAQREIGAALGVSAMAVQRMETAMEKQPDVRAFLAVLRVPLRKPRGIRKATVTKRKKSRRA
jgi:hypothetical protein